ncbi:MAG: TSUP family transporter [Oscillospiraceae bacterium]|nr:TSUP family transporter [Oscillospiraceae bacterium]
MPDIQTFLIVCPLVLLAGFVDAIGGGGGLISLPAYLLAGLPAHSAIATNKLSSTCGTALATVRFARRGLMHWRTAWPSMAAGLAGSWCGAHLSMLVDSAVLERVLYLVLPLTALLVLRKDALRDEAPRREDGGRRTALIAAGASLLIGVYDGFYGPGTGTFLILAYSLLAGMDVRSANGQCKAVNLTTNVTSLLVYLRGGQVLLALGLAAAVCNMLGNWLGAGMAIRAGSRITRPIILLVLLLLLLLRLLGVY